MASWTCPNNQEPQFLHFKRTKAKRLVSTLPTLSRLFSSALRWKDGATVLVDRFPRPCENKGVGVGEGADFSLTSLLFLSLVSCLFSLVHPPVPGFGILYVYAREIVGQYIAMHALSHIFSHM